MLKPNRNVAALEGGLMTVFGTESWLAVYCQYGGGSFPVEES